MTGKRVLGGRESVRVCIAQISPAYMDREATALRAVGAIREAGAAGADLIVFPEVWLAGYPYWTEGWDSALPQWAAGRIRFHDEAVIVPGETTEMLGAAAAQAGINVVIGCNEIDSRPGVGTIYNSLLFFDRQGALLGRRRKIMPTFTERMFWGPGDGSDVGVIETDIGRIGGLICGENLMTPVRAAMIAMGEDIHVAVFPGAFALHTGPALEEWNMSGDFWGHFVTRAHAFEGGCFVLSSSGYLDPDDIPDDFAYKDRMNIGYARGGSQIVNPLGVPMAGPVEGPRMLYADCPAWMIKAVKAIVDTVGHYARPDIARIELRRDDRWVSPDVIASDRKAISVDRARLRRAADEYEVDEDSVALIADQRGLLSEK